MSSSAFPTSGPTDPQGRSLAFTESSTGTLKVSDEVSHDLIADFRSLLQAASTSGQVNLDLDEVTYFPSAALSVIVSAMRQLDVEMTLITVHGASPTASLP